MLLCLTFDFISDFFYNQVVQHGPFVMNTQDEINKTFQDYQLGQNGFENAPKWRSEGINRSLRNKD